MPIADHITSSGQKIPNHVLQSWLAIKGVYKGQVDGDFGKNSVDAARVLLVKLGIKSGVVHAWGRAPVALATEQAYLKERKLYEGAIDGKAGPLLRDAQERWQSALRSTDASRNPPAVAKNTLPSGRVHPKANNWPRQADVRDFYGKPGEHLVTIDLPYPMRLAWDTSDTVRRAQCHVKVAESLKAILQRILDHYGMPRIRMLGLDLFGGVFNKRKMKGGNALSMHSWGIAIDLDPDHNQLRWGANKARMDNPEYAFAVKCFEDEGWVSLGRARNYDWMHFQAARF